MAIRKIIRMGHPALRQRARPLQADEIGSDEFHRLVADMIDTLHDYRGVGLAAPQINESLRLAVIEIPGGPTRYGELDRVPLTVLVNPSIEVLDPTTAGYWEGCLSVPGLRGFVERPQHIRVVFTDVHGATRELEFKGFLATVIQHELDHLDGKLYIDRLTDPTKLAFEDEFDRYVVEEPSAS